MNFANPPIRFRIFALLFITLFALKASAADAAPETILLGANETKSDNMGKGLLIREQVRQAILMAAREDMGLTTRDEALREFDFLAAGADVTDVRLDVDLSKRVLIEVFRAGSKVWSGEMQISNDIRLHMPLTDRCNDYSHKEFVEALKAAGFHQTERPKAPEHAELADGIAARMFEMNFVSQFEAVRRLHEQARTQGQSWETLSALTRTYAILGALTEKQWYAADRVFKARALLYAQRLRRAYPLSAEALWNRAFARALTGFYGAALDDIKEAQKEKYSASRPATPPAWLAEIDAFCRYDVTALQNIAKQQPAEAQLATFLSVLDVTASAHGDELIERGKIALAVDPENYYVIDRMTGQAGVSYGHVLTTMAPQMLIARTLLATLPRCIKLPREVTDQIKVVRDRGEQATSEQVAGIWKSLVKAGEPDGPDRGEPSLAALGRIIEETHFLHTWRRAAFLRDSLGRDIEGVRRFVDDSLPLISADHPFRPYIEYFGVNRVDDPGRADDLITSVHAKDATLPARQWLFYLRYGPKGTAIWNAENYRLFHLTDYVCRDSEEHASISTDVNWRKSIASGTLGISPYSPYAMGAMIAANWPAQKAKAAEYETWAPGVAYLRGELAKKYVEDNRIDDATRCFKAYLEIVKDEWVYKDMANVHLKQGNEEAWLQDLETYLREGEDYALSHANVRKEIARVLMGRGKYHKALPYAEAAAGTGAAWAITVAAECHEGLGHLDQADELYHDAASYPGEIFALWSYRWRANRPDVAKAEKEALDYLEHAKVFNWDVVGAFYLLKGDRETAMKVYRDVPPGPMPLRLLMNMALAADEAGDIALRDQSLERASAEDKSIVKISSICKLAIMFRGALEAPAKPLDFEVIDKMIEGEQAVMKEVLNEMTGRFLLLHGDKELAQRYLKAAIQSSHMSDTEYNLAWGALKKHGQDPRKLRDVVKD
jgi:hypothetical protein